MTPIRPSLPPAAAPTQPARAGEARIAAQKAFFALAAGGAQPAAAPAATPAPAPAPSRIPAASAEPPARPLRPGSLLDIRV